MIEVIVPDPVRILIVVVVDSVRVVVAFAGVM